MKKLVITAIFISLFASVSFAQGNFGLGIIVGEPTGISGKYHLSQTSSIDGALGWSFAKYGALHIHGDYLYNVTRLTPEIPFYIGVGGRIKSHGGSGPDESDTRLAIRVPVGLAYEPRTVPIDVFLEVVPMLDITPSSDFAMNAAIGIRYYFP